MKIVKCMICLIALVFLFSCGDGGKNEESSNTDKILKETTGMTQSEIESKVESTPARKKYTIKSGQITFERKGVIGNQKIIVYFDDYGIRERNETYNEDGSLEEIRFTDGENMYKILGEKIDEKIAYLMGSGMFGTEMKFESDPFKNNDKRREKYQFKKLDNMNILGKDCEVYSMTTGGNVTTFGGWNSLHLYSKVDMSIGITETIAVDLKENISVDPELFKVPSDFKVQQI